MNDPVTVSTSLSRWAARTLVAGCTLRRQADAEMRRDVIINEKTG